MDVEEQVTPPEAPAEPDAGEIKTKETDGTAEPQVSVEEPKTSKSLKGWWIKTILMLALVVVSVVVLFQLGGYLTGEEVPQYTLPQLLRSINYPLFALLLGVILLYIAVESGKYAYMLKVHTGKFHFKIAVKTMFLGKYYDGITPLSTGGQPFQIYYLHKKKIPSGAASAIPVMRYVVSIIFLSTLSVVLLAITPRFVPESNVNLTALIISWISLAINLMFPTALVLFSIFPKAGKKAALGLIALLAKMHIVKNKERTQFKFIRLITDYSATLKQFGREFFKYVPLYILCILESLLFVTIPFFVVIAIANVQPTVELAVQIACLVIISRYMALLIPTPGNTGALEVASSLVFVTVSGIEPVIGWTILVWRFLTYYVYILSGIGINIFEIIRSAVRNRRARQKKE